MTRFSEMTGGIIRLSFLLIGLAAGLWLLYTAGPGWDDYKPPVSTRGGVWHTPAKTTASRLMMLAAGIFFGGGSAYYLTMPVLRRK